MREKSFQKAEKFSMSALAATVEREARELLPRVIGQECAKVIAFKAGSTRRSAANWQKGENLPTVPHFIALARQYPELRRKVLDWLDASTGDSGDDPSRLLDEIARFLHQKGKR
jgi:hypothetical protein